MSKRLSSIITPVYKLLPFTVAGYTMFILIRDWSSFRSDVFFFFLLWCSMFYALTYRWKNVHLQGQMLRVSNYIKRINIPVSAIKKVEASSWWGRQRTIKITLWKDMGFGKTIIFVPRLFGRAASEIEQELRQAKFRAGCDCN